MPRLIDANALMDYCNNLKDKTIDANDIARFPSAVGWISVKDGLPDKNGQYLCWFGKNTVIKGAAIVTYLEMWKAFGSLESLETYPNVTHWMPIEPPKEDKDDA